MKTEQSSEFHTTEPATGVRLGTYSYLSDEDIPAKADRSMQAFQSWRTSSFPQRAELLLKVAEGLGKRKNDLAERMTREMGKPLSSGIAEIEKCIWVCEYYAEHAEGFLSNEDLPSDAERSYIAYQPLGPVLAIMPWNFPFWQVFRFAAPALMAGNAAILKHAEITTACALDIEELFQHAGAPDGLFQTLLLTHDGCETLIRHPAVQAVTLTGSTGAGKKVASIAGSELKKVVLELGGNDPYLVLADADPEKAAEICVKSRMVNNGETCIAAKRFITQPENHDAFVEAVVRNMKAYGMGDPMDASTTLGPMASERLRKELHDQVLRSLDEGAECLLGGDIPEGKGFYYPATVLSGVTPDMTAAREELFGPVAVILRAQSEENALQIANDSDFGLGACVITGDVSHGQELAETKVEAGACFVNTGVASDPRLPFGGIKKSGFGRELSHLGIREFCNIKTVYIA